MEFFFAFFPVQKIVTKMTTTTTTLATGSHYNFKRPQGATQIMRDTCSLFSDPLYYIYFLK